jgi:thioredoxin reductase
VDRRKVIEVTRDPEWFSLPVQDGEPFRAKCVIVATGIAPFAWRSPQFSTLPPDAVSHSVEHRDFSEYAGWRILVVAFPFTRS